MVNNYNCRCHFCGSVDHTCRECPIEKKASKFLKKEIGKKIEFLVADNISCPHCSTKTLRVVGNNSPSWDIYCSNCEKKYEVKSKCLSCRDLPNDLSIHHGNYKLYSERQNEGLDFIVVIYGVDRKKKISYVRKIIHIPDQKIKLQNNFIVRPNIDNNYCNIFISNHNLHNAFKLKKPLSISFKDEIKIFME